MGARVDKVTVQPGFHLGGLVYSCYGCMVIWAWSLCLVVVHYYEVVIGLHVLG
jgi:hypothetical protein